MKKKISDSKTRELISNLLRKEAEQRPSPLDALNYDLFLASFRDILLPISFVTAQAPYTNPDSRMMLFSSNLQGVLRGICPPVSDAKVRKFDRFTAAEIADAWSAAPGSVKLR